MPEPLTTRDIYLHELFRLLNRYPEREAVLRFAEWMAGLRDEEEREGQ